MVKIADQYLLILLCRYDDIIKARSREKLLYFISISISPITTNFTVKMTSLQWPYFTVGDDATIIRSRDGSL